MSGTFYFPVSNPDSNWSECTLVLPCVAVGNVAQLTVDLLISSLLKEGSCKLVGRISSSCLRPVAGPNAFDIFSPNVMTSCEVYESAKNKLVVVQLRSPPFQGKSAQFIASLIQWIKQSSFSRVIELTSSFSQFLSGLTESETINPVRYLAKDAISGIQPLVKVEKYSLKPSETGVINLPGSGFALKLYRSLCDEAIDVQVLVKYCSEGDNTQDAFQLMNVLNTLIKVRPIPGNIKWDVPVSWNKLFGEDHPTTLF